MNSQNKNLDYLSMSGQDDSIDVDSLDTSISFKVRYLGFMLAIIIGLTIFCIAIAILKLSLQESISVVSLFLVFFTLWYLANNLFVNVTVNKQKHNFDRKVVALNMITEWYKDFSVHSRKVRDYRVIHMNNNHNTINQSVLINDLDVKDENVLRIHLIPILNYFEKISIAVLRNTADERIIKDYFEDIFVKYLAYFDSVIQSRQDGQGGLPNAFINFKKVASDWKNKK